MDAAVISVTNAGTTFASAHCMALRHVEDVEAWQLAHAFKLEAYRIVKASPAAMRDFCFRDQLFESARSGASNIEEGFYRYRVGQLLQFLSYAQASINEARGWLKDGVDRGHYEQREIVDALALGARAAGAVSAWRRSLAPFTRNRRHSSICDSGRSGGTPEEQHRRANDDDSDR